MRNLFLRNAFLCASIAFFAALAVALAFTGCQKELVPDCETVEFSLPQWNGFSGGRELPGLSRWKIRAGGSDFVSEYYAGAESQKISFEVGKNEPFYVLAYPVTRLADGSESQFFKPAGAIYPYAAQGDFYSFGGTLSATLTWEAGFSAFIMEKIILSKKQAGASPAELKTFLMQFNWKKMQERIEKNLLESLADFSDPALADKAKFYNPWHINQQKLIENLSALTFDSNLLNTTSIFTVPIEGSSLCAFKSLLSGFVPENQILQAHGRITVKKHLRQIFLLDNSLAAILDATSAKNISVELGNMPILTEDYENSE